jgi:hypothetical protein
MGRGLVSLSNFFQEKESWPAGSSYLELGINEAIGGRTKTTHEGIIWSYLFFSSISRFR